MAFGAVSWGNFDANGSFVRGALAPGGRAQASRRAGAGERVALSSAQPALGGAKPLGVMRNLRAVRDLLGTHQSLGELTRDLREMQAFVRSVQGAPLSEETRAALTDRIAGLNSRLREGVIAQGSGREYRASVVPAFTAAAAPSATETAQVATAARRAPAPAVTFTEYINASNERILVTSQIVQRTIQEVSTAVSTVLDEASTMMIGNAYGSKQFSTVDVSQAAVNATFSLSKIVNSYNVVGAGSTITVGATLGSNTVTAINVSGAANATFKLKQTIGSLVELKNNTTGQAQTVDVSVLAAQSGSKTLNFDQLGVSFTFTGASQTGLALAAAFDKKDTVVARQTDYSVKLTNVGTGANQTLLVNGLGESADVARLDFTALGVSLTFSGGAGTTVAFVDALAGKTVQTREQVTETVTLTTEEYVVETETIVNESYVIPVEHEIAVRDYDSIATAQSAPAVSEGVSPDRALSTLDARIEGVVAELSARQAALEEQMMALARGDGLDAASAREAVRALAADVFGLAEAHASLTGSMVAALFADTPSAPKSTTSKPAASKPAPSEPSPARSQ